MYNPVLSDDFDNGRSNTSYYEKKQSELKSMKQRLLDSTKNLLAKKGFYILPVNIYYAYSTAYESVPISIDVLTSSTDSLQLVYNIINNNVKLYGKISSISSSNEGEYDSKLLKKLVNKATGKATEIAALSGMKIGNIISLREDPSAKESGGWVAYPPRSAVSTSMEPGWHESNASKRYYSSSADERSVNEQYKIENSIVVRFSVQ
jgi:hypothetical protein